MRWANRLAAIFGNLALVVIVNLIAAAVVYTVLFIAVSSVARRVADERVQLTSATESEVWRARAQRFSVHDDDRVAADHKP